MPFVSQAQRRFMYSQHPGIARRFERETPAGKLPEKVDSSEARRIALRNMAKGK